MLETKMIDISSGADGSSAGPSAAAQQCGPFEHPDRFVDRHIGPRGDEIPQMLEALGLSGLEELVEAAVPASIRTNRPLRLPKARGEYELLNDLRSIAA